ncbi:hypothetical protein E2C01_015643 [Portunus trituberculatus]|uniref:Uncharacterized protein n=1 Tax=Portunus trituberculatus TaxID=210409 RepID=A0A5B7DN71_PORTR|nr:hypothetical protein [Portunus trituberculatus]
MNARIACGVTRDEGGGELKRATQKIMDVKREFRPFPVHGTHLIGRAVITVLATLTTTITTIIITINTNVTITLPRHTRAINTKPRPICTPAPPLFTHYHPAA